MSSDSLKYEPPLEAGADLQILEGPVAASGYWWYRVRLLDGMTLRDGIAGGWVAASDHDGTAWIDRETDGYLPGPDTEDPDNPAMATPVLVMGSAEAYVDAFGASYIRHEMTISNWAVYPPELFAARPGEDTCASRTQVEIVDAGADTSVMVFCGLTQPHDLVDIWFGTAAGFAPPASVKVVLSDEETGNSVESNPVEVCPLAYGPGCIR